MRFNLQGSISRWKQELTWRRVVLSIVLAMSLRTFTFFPGFRALEELWFGVCVVGVLTLYPLFKLSSEWTFAPWELYLLLVLPVLIVLPAVTAHNEFGQPLLYGLLVRRSVALEATWLVFLGAWRTGWITKKDVELALLFLTWVTFVLYTLMRFLLNPQNYPGAPPGFILGANTAEAFFAVPGCFMVFGVLYYALRGLRTARSLDYLLSALLFFNAIGPSGRFLTVSLLATIFYFLLRWRPIAQILTTLLKGGAIAAIALAIAFSVAPDLVEARFLHFQEAFQVISGGQGQDASANARIVETDIALPYIKRHPLLGVGILSNQWVGSGDAIATYFFTDDIGFVGIMFNYGALGLALLAMQYLFAIVAGMRIPANDADALTDGVKAFVLYSAIYSATTGLFVFSFEQSSFFITLLILLSRRYSRSAGIFQPSATYSHALSPVSQSV